MYINFLPKFLGIQLNNNGSPVSGMTSQILLRDHPNTSRFCALSILFLPYFSCMDFFLVGLIRPKPIKSVNRIISRLLENGGSYASG